ncbi:MAG: outer membrane protein transport protein [Helicobacteraceae bacterium]|jgi:long-chain fatty acid transport protein|nr:outer membrane protein transport protein [Helicobacteraceae bacterium]
MALGATSAFATNGTNLIGYGAQSRAMGGTAISNFNGAESAFANPALITSSTKTTEATVGATLLMPDVSFEADAFANMNLSGGSATAASDNSSTAGDGMVPSVAVINKVNDSFAWGLALYGVGGMGVDYRTTTPDSAITGGRVNDNLMLMRMSVPLAYTISGFSVGIAPVIEYGALSIQQMDGSDGNSYGGVTTDIAIGFEVGAAYTIAGVSLGLDYKSAVTHDFENTFNSSMTGGVQSKLDTPAVIGAGVSYEMAGNTIAFDYKNIAYGSAKGFEDFGWDDQDVFALGYEYAAESWAVRLGYNYGASPLPTDIASPAVDGGTSFNQVAGSMMMFPAVCESHYTVGGSYSFTDVISADLALMYATGSATAATPDLSDMGGAPAGEITATNDQTAVSFALNYAY